MKYIFICYSTKDYEYKDELKKSFFKLEKDKKITLWIDEEKLKSGEKFTEEIEKNINKADIILLLISRNFWASDYILTNELPLIQKNEREKRTKVIPIVLKDLLDLKPEDLELTDALPRKNTRTKDLTPIDDFESKDRAYNLILTSITEQHLSQDNEIEVFSNANYNSLKVFIGYSYKDKELIYSTFSELKIPDNNLEQGSDLKEDEQWINRVYQAVIKAEYVVLFLTPNFCQSNFIEKNILDVVFRQYHIGKCKVSLFNLSPCQFQNKFLNIEPLTTIEELNGLLVKLRGGALYLALDETKAIVSNEFCKKSNKILDKQNLPKINKDYNSNIKLEFDKLFLIFKVLEKYEKEKKQSVKMTSESNIEFYENGILREKWKFITTKDSIQEYAEIYKNSFNIKNDDFVFGLFQDSPLDTSVSNLQYFFQTLKNLYSSEITNELIKFVLSQHSTINPFLQTISDNKILNISFLDFNKDINQNNGTIFFFLRFKLDGYRESNLITEVYNLIEKRFKISISKDNGQLYTSKSFIQTFNKALGLLEGNKEIDFDKLIDSIDLLKSTLELIEDLSFIERNIELIKQPIVQRSNVNIAQIFIEPTAKFFYTTNKQYEIVKHLPDWFNRELKLKNFLLLLGDFGHGKTTLFKYLTAKLSENYAEGQPIPVFLTLREHFKTISSVQEAVVNAIMVNTRMSDNFWKSHSWIIFCDGFDELNIFHQDRPEWVTLVFSALYEASKQSNIKIIISSRPILFMEESINSKTIGKFETLFLENFNNEQISTWLANWSQNNQLITISMLIERDIIEIARTPIILFLIALMFHDELAKKSEKYSKSKIYQLFFNWTVKNGGFVGDDIGIKHKVPNNYREILQEIAWQIFVHPNSKSGLLHYQIILKQLMLKLNINNFNFDERIFVAHAFKESKKEHIEFLHQSLREYLIAEKIFEVYYKIINEPDYQIEIAYEKILLDIPITEAKLRFFIDMVKSISNDDKSLLKTKAKNISHWVTILYQIAKKDSSRFSGYEVYRRSNEVITKEHLFSENQIVLGNLVLLGYFFEGNLYDIIEEDFNLELFKQIQHFFKSDIQLEQLEKLFQKLFFSNLSFFNIELDKFNFDSYSFNIVKFKNLKFNDCSFEKIKLTNVIWENISFNNCRFIKLEWSTFEHNICEYKSCYFYRYNYQNKQKKESVTYIKCIFEASDLYYENFRGAVFENCLFIDSSFSTNEEINKDIVEIEFIDCLIKKGIKFEVLNGIKYDLFIKTH